jgi:hypothetical protein
MTVGAHCGADVKIRQNRCSLQSTPLTTRAFLMVTDDILATGSQLWHAGSRRQHHNEHLEKRRQHYNGPGRHPNNTTGRMHAWSLPRLRLVSCLTLTELPEHLLHVHDRPRSLALKRWIRTALIAAREEVARLIDLFHDDVPPSRPISVYIVRLLPVPI